MSTILVNDDTAPVGRPFRFLWGLSHRHAVTVVAAVLGLVFGTTLLALGWLISVSRNPPLIVQSSRLIDTTVPVNGKLRFHIRAAGHIDRACLGSITREFYTHIDVDGKNYRYKERSFSAAPIVQEGETEYVIGVDLPRDLPPGLWQFQGETTYDCGVLWSLFNDFPGGVFRGGVVRFRTELMSFKIVGN